MVLTLDQPSTCAQATQLLTPAFYRQYFTFETETGICSCLSLILMLIFQCLSPMTGEFLYSYLTGALKYLCLLLTFQLSVWLSHYTVCYSPRIKHYCYQKPILKITPVKRIFYNLKPWKTTQKYRVVLSALCTKWSSWGRQLQTFEQ